MVNFSCFHTVTRLTLILTARPPTPSDCRRDTNKPWCCPSCPSCRFSILILLQTGPTVGVVTTSGYWCLLMGKNENKQWITVSYSPGTGPELNNINVRIMFPLSRYRGSGTNIWCNELLASHRLQPPAVSPSDVCHDVDVVCKASASYYYRSSYSHPTQNSQLKIYPQCKTGNVINE